MGEGFGSEPREVKDNESWEKSEEWKRGGVEMGRENDKRGEKIQVPRFHLSKKWRDREACGGKGEESGRSHEGGMGDWKEMVWERCEKKIVALRCAGVNSHGIWSGDMGLEGERTDGESTRKIWKMSVRAGLGDAGLYAAGRIKDG